MRPTKPLGVLLATVLFVPSYSVAASPVQVAGHSTGAASSNMRFVKNIPYRFGTDIEFGEFTVRELDVNGEPICVRRETGECDVDQEGNVVYETEQRDYAFTGTQALGVRVIDITDPSEASVVAFLDCDATQADIQVRPDLGLLVIAADFSVQKCGLSGEPGLLIVDVSDPRFPKLRSSFPWDSGAHNVTFHPSEPLLYLSNPLTCCIAHIPIVDVSDPANPTLVRDWNYGSNPLGSPHDITFDRAGTRAYAAAGTHTDILDTSDPRNPRLITSIIDPAINVPHQADPTPDGNYLVISDEAGFGLVGPSCPGPGLHFYDISDETQPAKVGFFTIDQVGPAIPAPGLGVCGAHVFRIAPDGNSLTIGWYNGGTRVVDISAPETLGAREIAYMVPSGMGGHPALAESWASKGYKGYIYSSDRERGLDIMELVPSPGSGRAYLEPAA